MQLLFRCLRTHCTPTKQLGVTGCHLVVDAPGARLVAAAPSAQQYPLRMHRPPSSPFNDPLRWKFTVEEVRANWFFALSVALLMQRSYFQRRVHPAWERWEWNFFSTARFQLIQFIATSQAEFVSDKGKS
ncbi:Protein of unknown function [Gryllus bimaculatus]|nr:Protein of unknown function [Gryllus bimaculatus]